jgi:hypothetical protein
MQVRWQDERSTVQARIRLPADAEFTIRMILRRSVRVPESDTRLGITSDSECRPQVRVPDRAYMSAGCGRRELQSGIMVRADGAAWRRGLSR